MRILVTGADGNIGRGIVPRLVAAGHEVVASDLNVQPETTSGESRYVQCDVQAGFGLERAIAGCDLLLHLPAWHGIHWRAKTEVDFWRLNVDGTFYAFQAAREAGVKRVCFLSSQAWHGHYDKYGFTKVIGEELCEYHRRNNGISYVAVRPNDLTPYRDYLHYGTRLLYGGVDRDDVLDSIEKSVAYLLAFDASEEAAGVIVDALRPNAFTEAQISDWESDPIAAAERIFLGAKKWIEIYGLDVKRKPSLAHIGPGAAVVGFEPRRHFGTFLQQLAILHAERGEQAVRAMRCPY